MNIKNKYNYKYDHKFRWISYWHQINNTLNLNPSSVLEIGIGNGLFSQYIRGNGISITTVDKNSQLFPNIISDITSIPIKDNQYDLVCAFQIIEHLSLEKVDEALLEMSRLSKKWIIISLPQNVYTFKFLFKIPMIKEIRFLATFSKNKKNIYNKNNGHYWELGNRGTDKKWIIKKLKGHGFNLVKNYTLFEHPYHIFFIFNKE